MGLEIQIWEEKRGKEETSGNINIQREGEKEVWELLWNLQKNSRGVPSVEFQMP